MDPTGYDRKRSNLIFFSSHGVCRVVPFDVRRIRRKKIKDKEREKKRVGHKHVEKHCLGEIKE